MIQGHRLTSEFAVTETVTPTTIRCGERGTHVVRIESSRMLSEHEPWVGFKTSWEHTEMCAPDGGHEIHHEREHNVWRRAWGTNTLPICVLIVTTPISRQRVGRRRSPGPMCQVTTVFAVRGADPIAGPPITVSTPD